MTTSFSTQAVRLRDCRESDLEFVLEAEHDAAEFVCNWSRDRHLDAVKSLDCDHLVVQSVFDDRLLGFVMLSGITDPDKSINLKRIVITDPGKGYGRAVLRRIMARVFNEYGAHRLWLDVRTQNVWAQTLYESEGFIREGVFRECDKVGDHYESLIIMSILEDEFRHL